MTGQAVGPFARGGLAVLLIALICACSPSQADVDRRPDDGPRRVARLPAGAELAYGAFSHGAMSLFSIAAPQPRPRLLVQATGDASHPAWSPDGHRLVFVSNTDGRPVLRVFGLADGATADLVTHPPRSDGPLPDASGALSWSRGQGTVAFSSALAGDADVWLATTDGTGRAGLLIQGPGGQTAPAWSPDGRRLAFACTGTSGPADSDICVATERGTDVRHVTSGPTADSDPSWSPDGTRIAYSAHPTCTDRSSCLIGQIMAVVVEGGEPENLSRATDDDYSPAWSPDGSVIAFTRNAEIWLMGSDGSNQAPLVAGLWPAWRP